MAKRRAFDADEAEDREIDGEAHCFIVRVGDELFEAILQHQQRLSRVLRRRVSRAAAAREALGRILPRRRQRKPNPSQCSLFGQPLQRNPLVAVEAQRVASRAAGKLVGA